MAHLAAWLAACVVVAVALRNRLHLLVALVIALWIGVPAVAGHLLTGVDKGTFAIHPATWLVATAFVVQLLAHPRPLVGAVMRHIYLAWVMVVFVVGAFVTSRLMLSGGTALLLDQIVGPGLTFWLMLSLADRPRRVLFVRSAFLTIMALECVLSLTQLATEQILVYANDYATQYWFVPGRFNRWMGTLDTPLAMSLCLAVAAAMAIGIRNWVVRSMLLVLYLLGDLVTQSRTGVAVLCLVIVVAIVRGRMAVWARALATVAMLIAGYFILTSRIVVGLSQRFANDTGSTNARIAAVEFVAQSWQRYLFVGDGLTSSYTIATVNGLQTSLESSLLMYAIDVGFVLAIAYFGAQIVLLVRYGRQRVLQGATLAAILACLVQHSFSAVASANATGTVIWLSLAVVVAAYEMEGHAVSSTQPEALDTPDRLRQPTGDAQILATSPTV